MPEEALLDAPTEDLIDTDISTDTSDTDSDATDDSTPVDTDPNSETPTDTAPVVADPNGSLKLSETARTELDRIKNGDPSLGIKPNPQLAREMRAALFDRHTILAKVPGGVKEALATIEAYEEAGGSDAYEELRQETQAWKDLDADFQRGDPKFVTDIAEGNPEAFVKIAQHVMDEYARRDSAGYSYQVSKVFAQDMAANNVVLTMERLKDFLYDASGKPVQGLERAAQQWDALAGYIDRVNGMAKTPPKQDATPTVKPGEQQPQNDREKQLTLREFGSERTRALESVTEGEWKKQLGSRKASSEQTSAIRELYNSRLDKMLRADKTHTSKVDRFFAAGDREGYAKHMAQMYRTKAPMAMEQAFKAVMPGKPGPQKVTTQPTKPGNPAKPATPAAGFTRVAQKPNKNDIDWPATTAVRRKAEDQGKYVMRDGSKVMFQR